MQTQSQEGWGGAQDPAFPTSPQVTQMLQLVTGYTWSCKALAMHCLGAH